MKKLFEMSVIGVILVALSSATTVRASAIVDKQQKERVKIVVVDKKGQAGGQPRKPANEDRDRRP